MLRADNDAKKSLQMVNVVAWFFGILFVFSGLMDMLAHFMQGILFTLIGLVILPPFWRFVEKKTKLKNGWIIRIIVFVVLVVIFGTFGGK